MVEDMLGAGQVPEVYRGSVPSGAHNTGMN